MSSSATSQLTASSAQASHAVQSRLAALFLFLAALAPRLPGLGRFLTSDENTNIFFAGSDVIAAFLQGNFRGTYWHFYPGVTMSWLDAAGMAGQYLIEFLSGAALPPFTDYIYGDILSLLVANRLPYVALTAAAVPAIYLLARQLVPERAALLGALFLAFDPFYLAHSRVAHGDAPLAVFMSLSALTFFIYVRQVSPAAGQRKRAEKRGGSSMLVASAVLGGLAALTKAPGPFIVLFVISLSAVYAGLELYRLGGHRLPGADGPLGLQYSSSPPGRLATSPQALSVITRWLKIVITWGLIGLAVFVLLWPAMWVDPIGTTGRMLLETFGKVEEGHLVYFFGQPTLDPGPWFYFYVIPFRLTPVVLIGALASLILLVGKAGSVTPTPRGAVFLFWLFIISLLLFGNLSPKKQDRYLLPLFPFIDLLAAVGWMGLFNLGQYFFRRQVRLISYALVLILCLHFIPVITYYPYYLTYFNPLMGGPTRAAQTTLMGWGEGMEQAAAYLNAKPNAKNLYVASTPSQTLLPYFAGTGENFYTNDIALRADYVVLYLAQMQRQAPSPEIVNYFQAQQPEKIITIHNVPYVKIYPGPKLILTDIPPTAVPVNVGLDDKVRLAGFEIHTPSAGSPKLILYWHALAPLTANYTISVRARAADGRLLAQQDNWPVSGLLPTTLWRQGDYVTDSYVLEIPPADKAQLSHFEIVVYNAETNQTLGPPTILLLDSEK